MRFIEKHPIIMIIIGILGISVSSILVKYSDAPSLITAAYRLLWTVILMTPVIFGKSGYRNELFSTDKKTLGLCAVSGIFLALHFVTWFDSLRYTSVASSTTIVCTEVIWVALGCLLFLHEKITLKAAGAIAVTILGSFLIAFADSGEGGQLYGDFLALFAAVVVAGYTLIGRIVRKNTSTAVYTYIVYLFCSMTLVIGALLSGLSLTGWSGRSVLVGFWLAVLSTILGHSIFSWCLKFFSASFVSASKLCEPAAAALMAFFFFGEVPSPMQTAGGIIIILGVLYYSKIETSTEQRK